MTTSRSLIESFYDIQQMRIEVDNKLRAEKQGVSEQEVQFMHESVSRPLIKIEEEIKKHIHENLKDEEIYQWLTSIKGIGPILAGGLIAWIGDIERFPTISKLWSFSGMAAGYTKSECAKGHKIISTTMPLTCPVFGAKKATVVKFKKFKKEEPLETVLKISMAKLGQEERERCGAKMTLLEKHEGEIARREVGWFILQNTRLKTHLFKVGSSFIKTEGFGRELYEKIRAEYNEKWQTPEDCKSKGCAKYKKCLDAHKLAASMRKVEKIFLASLHMKWSEIKGLPISHPFIIGREGHSHLIKPEDWH